uniref:RING-type domain-containing protein n=1 Tax=Eutreptiella gymnastica TaxID=73025 RepID=A0A7S4CB86_9EUGL
MEDLDQMVKGLNRRKTFLESVAKISALFQGFSHHPSDRKAALMDVLKRVSKVLNARYTDEDYWHAGLELFTLGLSVSEDPKDTELLQSYIDRCNEHFDDAKPHVQSTSNGTTTTFNPFEPSSNRPGVENVPFDAAYAPVMFVTESMLDQLSCGDGPPPASREARSSLGVVTITEEGATCCVCQESLPVKSKAQKMPCGHLFHWECLIEWLERHNSCPICRHRLPSEKQYLDDEADAIQRRPAEKTNLYS